MFRLDTSMMLPFDIRYNNVIGVSGNNFYIKSLGSELGNVLFNYLFNYKDHDRARKFITVTIDISKMNKKLASSIIREIKKIINNNNNTLIPKKIFKLLKSIRKHHRNVDIQINSNVSETPVVNYTVKSDYDLVNDKKHIYICMPNNFHVFINIGVLPSVPIRVDTSQGLENIAIHSALIAMSNSLSTLFAPIHVLDMDMTIEDIYSNECRHLLGNVFYKESKHIINHKKLMIILEDLEKDVAYLNYCKLEYDRILEQLACLQTIQTVIDSDTATANKASDTQAQT